MTATTSPIPDLDGFDTFYGVRISCIGEDGDMVMLGHVDDRTAVAVVRAYLRRLWQNQDEVDEYIGDRIARDPIDRQRAVDGCFLEAYKPVARSHAVNVKHCDRWPTCQEPDNHCGDPAPCSSFAEVWYLDTDARPEQPGAFPISYWRVD